MAIERADRVGETTSTTGTGTLNLSGTAADGGFRTFAGAGINSAATVEILLIDNEVDPPTWEVCESIFTNASPDTLTRGTLLSSSTGSRIDFANAPVAYITQPAARLYTNNLGGTQNEAFGQGASTSSSRVNQLALGHNAAASHNSAIAAGASSIASQQDAIALGRSAGATATGAIAIGTSALANHTSIVIGAGSTTNGAGQFVVGSSSIPIADVFIGRGVVSTAPAAVTYHGVDASGTNVAGGDFKAAAGRGTGTGASGKYTVQVAPPGSSGSTLNTLIDVGQFDADETAGNTRFLLYDVDSGALQRVKVGANNSGPGGSGRALYLDNT